jgi:hypothetical protein
MQTADIRKQWEGAAPGWARWETIVATWMEPATETMLAMAGVEVGAQVSTSPVVREVKRCALPSGLAHRGT